MEPPLTIADRPAAAAGTLSLLEQDISGTLPGFQVLGGVDYAVRERTSIGLNAHWARFGEQFQGQEAPIVIYSMATSSPEDAPRGMESLYSPNRLNVATSRAGCACILVANPKLFTADFKSGRRALCAPRHSYLFRPSPYKSGT